MYEVNDKSSFCINNIYFSVYRSLQTSNDSMTSVVNSTAMNSLMNGGISNIMNSGLYSGMSTPASTGLPGAITNSGLNSMAVGMNNLANSGSSSLGSAGVNQ